ncbi:MAG: YsnF/AvaK domain-containing protein [Actinomycetota bacterium]|nr:YsnF/AvaK domain-containing protein [Actinomycetota bacterium]
MSKHKRPQAYRAEPPKGEAEADSPAADTAHTLELREEQLIAHKDLRDLGDIEVRTEVDEVPGRLEVDAYREEVVVEHETVGQVVSERDKPWEEDGALVIPIYEEQLVVTKRLVLRERMRVRRVGVTERQLYQDTLRRERLVVEDPQHTGLVREHYPISAPESANQDENLASSERPEAESGFLGNLVRKALE